MRKTKLVTIMPSPDDTPTAEKNRDAGKVYKITEMPASPAEMWAFQVFQALARTGIDMPEHMMGSGMAGMAIVGLKALGNLPPIQANDLMAEMFSCIKIIRDKSMPDMSFDLLEEDIEEVSTRVLLRTEVFELHTGFSMAGVRQSLTKTKTIPPA